MDKCYFDLENSENTVKFVNNFNNVIKPLKSFSIFKQSCCGEIHDNSFYLKAVDYFGTIMLHGKISENKIEYYIESPKYKLNYLYILTLFLVSIIDLALVKFTPFNSAIAVVIAFLCFMCHLYNRLFVKFERNRLIKMLTALVNQSKTH